MRAVELETTGAGMNDAFFDSGSRPSGLWLGQRRDGDIEVS